MDRSEPAGAPPLPFCDIIMKGGITSGVVYPQAVIELAQKHRFRSIGGTSAGAIAAAMTAAAEHNREHGGFAVLGAAADAVATSLFGLFQPVKPFRGVFAVLMAALDKRRGKAGRALRVIGAVAGHNPGLTAAAVLPGLCVLAFAAAGGRGWEAWVLGVLALVLLPVAVWTGALLVPLLRDLPGNGYGICSGLGQDGGRTALTTWLTDTLDEIAGHKRPGAPATDEPLTFGDLVGPDPADPDIDLQIMTTDLTTGRPHRVPFTDRELMFSEKAFRRLFPARVVDHLVAHGAPGPDGDPDVFFLPRTERLPVVVAVRLSLSFPLLLAAVPLLARDWTLRDRDEGARPRVCWFSDGGLCSNFPIHFFDSLWPRWPTYGIMLDELDEKRHQERVWMPQTARQGRLGRFREIGSVGSFLWAMVSTMQNWRDNQQCVLPGYRERIVRIALADDEGGLNLNMKPETVRRLLDLGGEAGRRILSDFDFEAHRWRRWLASQEPLGAMFARMGRSWYDPDPRREALRDFLPRYARAPAEYGQVGDARVAAMIAGSAALVDATADWSDPVGRDGTNLPRPRGVLRLVPPI